MGYNQGKNEMITNVMRNTNAKDVKFSANVAVVVKETTNKNNEVSTTFVEFPYLKDRTTQAVFKCVIIGLLSDETINAELKERFASLENEDGKKCELKKGETYTPPTFTRLIANFAENYKIGYTDNEGKFHTVHTVTERQNLRALLLVNGKKIIEFEAASSNTRRALVHTLSSAAIANVTKEAKYLQRYEETTTETAKASAKKGAKKGAKETTTETAKA